MLKTIAGKKAFTLTVAFVLSVILIATVYADIKLITAKKGGTVRAERGAELVIPPGALAEDTVISARLDIQNDVIDLVFGPHGTEFNPPAVFKVSWTLINKYGIEDYTVYGPDGETIVPETTNKGLEYQVPHFSLYYYRRR
jgi:hypothetical protein